MTATEGESHVLPDDFSKSKVNEAVLALVNQAKSSAENALFGDISTTTRILMDVTAFKIPASKQHFVNIVLPHTPYPDDPDILLVIPDDMKAKTEPELVVARVKDVLQRTLPIRIREVMTVKQLKDEYSTFEGKRKLTKSIDLILADNRVFKNLSAILGREFYKKKKFPLAIHIDPELQTFDRNEFDYALKKTVFNISTLGTTSTLSVGHTHLSESDLTENISKISNWLMREFPGGWKNVAKLSLYSAGIPPIIIYRGVGTRNDIEGGELFKRRKHAAPAEDELSTMPGRRVRVYPGGRIRVLKDDIEGSDEELITTLGVEEELSAKRIRNDVQLEPSTKKKKQGKFNIEEKYVDETMKRQNMEDEQIEAAAAEEEEQVESRKPKPSKKKNKTKIIKAKK